MNTENAVERKTLLNAYERLQMKANQLNEIENLIEKLNQKFDRTENDPRPTEENIMKEPRPERVPDLIDLFNIVAERLDTSIHNIGNKTERLLQLID